VRTEPAESPGSTGSTAAGSTDVDSFPVGVDSSVVESFVGVDSFPAGVDSSVVESFVGVDSFSVGVDSSVAESFVGVDWSSAGVDSFPAGVAVGADPSSDPFPVGVGVDSFSTGVAFPVGVVSFVGTVSFPPASARAVPPASTGCDARPAAAGPANAETTIRRVRRIARPYFSPVMLGVAAHAAPSCPNRHAERGYGWALGT
jgi:hypothetical protein